MTEHVPLVDVAVSDAARRRVAGVLDSGRLAQGDVVQELEEAFAAVTGVRHCIAVSNGTVALQAALHVLGVVPGDEIITTPFTFIATANAAIGAGASIRFADVDETYNIDPSAVGSLITERTKVIMPVHLFGLPADVTAIRDTCRESGMAILEDAAQAHGASVAPRNGSEVYAGAMGDMATFSLYATKNLSAGEGGLITTNDDETADRLRVLRNQGMRARYDYREWGTNLRMSDLHAAVVVDDVYRLPEINAIRSRNADRLVSGLAGIPGLSLPIIPSGYRSAWHQFTVRVDEDAPFGRDEFVARLSAEGVGTGVFYPQILPAVAHVAASSPDTCQSVPVADRLSRQVVSLPVGHHLSVPQIDRVVEVVRQVFGA